MFNFLIWLIVGAIVGWVASRMLRQDALFNIVFGMVGASLAGFFVTTPLLGIGTIAQGTLSLPVLLVSVIGAIVLLMVVNLFRRGVPAR